jgi:hypothetical protein
VGRAAVGEVGAIMAYYWGDRARCAVVDVAGNADPLH